MPGISLHMPRWLSAVDIARWSRGDLAQTRIAGPVDRGVTINRPPGYLVTRFGSPSAGHRAKAASPVAGRASESMFVVLSGRPQGVYSADEPVGRQHLGIQAGGPGGAGRMALA